MLLHLIFWLYILSLVITVLSIFATIIVYLRISAKWMKWYIHVLIALSLILLLYTVFYFLGKYGHAFSDTVQQVEIFLITISGSYLLFVFLRMVVTIFELDSSTLLKRVIQIIFIILIIIAVASTIFFKNRATIIIGGTGMMTVFLVICILLFRHIKILFADKSKLILVYFIVLSVLMIPMEFAEYMLHKKYDLAETNILLGLITFSLFCLIYNTINLFYSISTIKRIVTFTPVSDYHIPDSFFDEFSLTEREKQIIHWLLRGYSNKLIGHELQISKRTVDRHVYNIYQKCDIVNRIDLINSIQKFS